MIASCVYDYIATAAETMTHSERLRGVQSCARRGLAPERQLRGARKKEEWAVTCLPMPMPQTVCRTTVYSEIVQLEVGITCSGRGMGMNITAQGGPRGHCRTRPAGGGLPRARSPAVSSAGRAGTRSYAQSAY